MLQSASANEHAPKTEKPEPRKHSNLRVLGCGLAQLLAEYGMATLLSIPILGLPIVLRSWNMAIPIIIATFLFATVLSIVVPLVAGPLLLGNVRPGLYPLWGGFHG